MISYKIVLIATTIGVLPFFLWFSLLYKNSQTKKWKNSFIVSIFFIGVFSALPASILEIIYNQSANYLSFLSETRIISSGTTAILVAVIIEELSKGLGIIYLISRKKNNLNPNVGIIMGILVGLAFAITENGVYFSTYVKKETLGPLLQITLLRYIISTTAHVVYSGFFGYFWGMFIKEKKINYSLLALIASIGIHFLFNSLLDTAFSVFGILFVIIGLVILIKIFVKNRKYAS